MSYAIDTTISMRLIKRLLTEIADQSDSYKNASDDWFVQLKEMHARETSVSIDVYAPQLSYPNSWLSAVEGRIRSCVMPADHIGELAGEWLTPEAARAAISFLRAGEDVLPAEPHVYATPDGELVAEFEAQDSHMTSVVSDQETTLFGVRASAPNKPIQKVIRRGSNHYRDEVRSFTKQLRAGDHGKMVSAK